MSKYVTYNEMLVCLKEGKKARNRFWHESHHIKINEKGYIIIWEKLSDEFSKASIFDPSNCLEKEEWEILE